jgi:lipid-A-disaccharide synthase
VKENLPLLLQAARLLTRLFPKIHFAIGLPEDWRAEWVKPLLKRYGDDLPLTLLFGQSRLLLKACDVAVLVAGTITLEAACLGIPSVVVFWMGLLNRLQAHWLRWSATPERIANEVADLLRSHDRREEMRQRLLRVWDKIGEPCVATRIAHFLVSWVEEKPY